MNAFRRRYGLRRALRYKPGIFRRFGPSDPNEICVLNPLPNQQSRISDRTASVFSRVDVNQVCFVRRGGLDWCRRGVFRPFSLDCSLVAINFTCCSNCRQEEKSTRKSETTVFDGICRQVGWIWVTAFDTARRYSLSEQQVNPEPADSQRPVGVAG